MSTVLPNTSNINGILELAKKTEKIDAKLDLELEDKFLNTPLAVAINCRHFPFVYVLIESGASLKGYIYEEPVVIRR